LGVGYQIGLAHPNLFATIPLCSIYTGRGTRVPYHLTEPWHGDINRAGLGYAGLAGIGWAAYILLTQRIGDRFTGPTGLSLTLPITAATAAVVGIPQATGHLTLDIVAAATGLALLLPVLPFAFELLELRQMTPTAFGTLMVLEPAIGVLLGLLVLHQKPSTTQLVRILLVVLAGAAAQYGGRRRPRATVRTAAPFDLDLTGDVVLRRPTGAVRDNPG
jgi:inner membrane transporter RhtA